MCQVKLDSSKMLMDCHAHQAARNDRKINTRRILGFLMRNRGFQAIGKGVTLGGNDRRQSRRIHDLSQKDKIPQRIENA